MEQFISISKTEYEELKKKASDGVTFLKENQVLHSENAIASKIQKSMLPGEKVLCDDLHLTVYADMDSAKEVGGDFYDYLFLDENHLFFCIGDVSGKGVPAIIHMVACKMLLRSQLKHLTDWDSLGDIFSEINEELYMMTSKRQFVTCFAGIYDVSTGKLMYINAGHTKTLIVGREGITELSDVSGLPLGVFYNKKHPEKNEYNVFETVIESGDILFAYTDGCTEAMNSKGKVFGIDNVRNILSDLKDKRSLEEIVKYIQRQVICFEDHEEQDDDLTVFALRRK